VPNAQVVGTWTFDGSQASCVTDNLGTCTIRKVDVDKNRVGESVNFTIDSVIEPSKPYNPFANHDGDGDSNGNTITVERTD
jgi:hypothetical protein